MVTLSFSLFIKGREIYYYISSPNESIISWLVNYLILLHVLRLEITTFITRRLDPTFVRDRIGKTRKENDE